MNKNLRIILSVTAGIAVIAAGSYFLWKFFFAPASTDEALIGSGGESAAGEISIEKPLAISDNPVFDYWINKKTAELYYLQPEGQIYKITASGEEQDTGSKALGGMSYIKPSADGTRVIVAFGYPRTPTFTIYTPAEKTWQALPEGTGAASWNPTNGNILAYLKENGAASNLYTLDLSTKRTQNIVRLTQKDLDLDWVSGDLIYLKDRPSNRVAGSAWIYNFKSRTIRTAIRDEVGLSLRWPIGALRGFKWSASALKIVDLNGAETAAVDIKTLPSKCSLNSLNAYCAAPLNQSAITAASYPDDYFRKSRSFTDDFYLIPLASAQLVGIKISSSAISGIIVDADRVELDGSRLLFINRLDRRLYSLKVE